MLSDARLYVISADGAPQEQAATLCAAIEGGADIVQLRNKVAAPADLVTAARQLVHYCHERGVVCIVNDHVDVAVEAGADGVHLGQDDAGVAGARRRLGNDRIIGRSTHTVEQAMSARAEGADYLGVGPVFATPTKPGRPATGVELLSAVADAVTLPWFAIGGVDASTIDAVLAAGATRVAVVRAVCAAVDPAAAALELKTRLEAWAPASASTSA
jgi:thiamine-phosphate pyrophosphorylase